MDEFDKLLAEQQQIIEAMKPENRNKYFDFPPAIDMPKCWGIRGGNAMKGKLKFKPKQRVQFITLIKRPHGYDIEWFKWIPKKERTMTAALTPEQQIAVIRRAAEKGLFIEPHAEYDEVKTWYKISHDGGYDTFKYFDDAVTRLNFLCPEPPRWQDDKGWQGVIKDCKDKLALRCHCDYSDGIKCKLYCHSVAPCNWGRYDHPPINPATITADCPEGTPYATLAEWEADNPVKPTLPAIKPCAHCGGEIEIKDISTDESGAWWGWECPHCRLTDGNTFNTKERAIAAANRRPELPEGLTELKVNVIANDRFYYGDMQISPLIMNTIKAIAQALKDRL